MADGSPDPNIGVTSNEPVGEKHLVLPYDDAPMVRRDAWARTCEFCGNPGFRRSRLRIGDLPWMVLLRWPVRCTRCGQRQRASLFTAIVARRPRPHGGDAAVGPQSWGVWTGQSTAAKTPGKQPETNTRTPEL